MKTLCLCLIAGAALALPVAGFAQSSAPDAAYCAALGDLYHRYVGSEQDRSPRPPPAHIAVAISQCRSDPAASIPVLEKALTNQKISLPKRG